jgi:hypothetical protein
VKDTHGTLIWQGVTGGGLCAKSGHERPIRARNLKESAMSIIKTVVLAASLMVVAAYAHATTRADLDSGYHGNTPVQTRPR